MIFTIIVEVDYLVFIVVIFNATFCVNRKVK